MRTRSSEWFGRTPWASSELKIKRSPASISTLTIFSPVGVGVHRVAVGGLRLRPFVEMLEELGHALEAADVAVLLLQAENALDADRQGIERGVDVPVDEAVRIALDLLAAG